MTTPQILAVVVRYKIPLSESQTLNGIVKAFAEVPSLRDDVRVLVWDNSPTALADPQLPIPFLYRHTGENLGVGGAFNRGLEIAEADGIPWMLTLDQDTWLTTEFLRRVVEYSREVESNPKVGSIVPFVRSNGTLVSPRRFASLNRNFQVERTFHGLLDADAYAVNSASLMRVAALVASGRYSREFWMDLSDVYIYQQMFAHGWRMYVAGDLELDHEVAGMNFEQDMVPEKYATFTAAEDLYLTQYRSRFENAFQTLRLLMRTLRQWRQYRDKRYARITWGSFLMRISTTRAKRLQLCRDQLRHKRDIPFGKAEGKA